MEVFSFLIFFIYAFIILVMLIYISPVVSVLVMLLLPLVSVFVLPEQAMDFLSRQQFSFVVPIHNIHILLLIWSALIGVIVYAEVLSWYLLREAKPKTQKKPDAIPEPPESARNKTMGFLLKFIKIMRGKK